MRPSCPFLTILSGAEWIVLDNGPPRPAGGRSNGDPMDDFIMDPEPVHAAAAARRAEPLPWARIGLLGIAVAALIAVAVLAFGAGASPTGTLAAGTTNNATTPLVDDLHGVGGPGLRGFGHGFGGIIITAISGNDISLKTADGWTRTITVDTGTSYSKSGDTIALGDLEVGDEIGFRQTRETDGSFTIDSIAVILPHAGGEVTAVSGTTITVKDRDGATITIETSGTTEFQVNGDNAALADVKVGMLLVAEGTKNSDGSLSATDVRAADAGSFRGPGGHDHGGPFGDRDGDGTNPSSTAAPSATGSAS
jgi:Domain of unknown function (DUF5666)